MPFFSKILVKLNYTNSKFAGNLVNIILYTIHKPQISNLKSQT